MGKAECWASLRLVAQEDVIAARQSGRQLGQLEGLSTADQTRLATTISELTRNVLLYAGTGVCEIFVTREPQDVTITVIVSDQGPGIADPVKAMTPGYSTGNGLGAGLPGVKRLMDSFKLDSEPGATTVEVSMTRRRLL